MNCLHFTLATFIFPHNKQTEIILFSTIQPDDNFSILFFLFSDEIVWNDVTHTKKQSTLTIKNPGKQKYKERRKERKECVRACAFIHERTI